MDDSCLAQVAEPKAIEPEFQDTAFRFYQTGEAHRINEYPTI